MRRIDWHIYGVISLLLFAADAFGQGQFQFGANLNGFQQVPAFHSAGTGEIEVSVRPDELSAEFEMDYTNLEGSVVLFAHLHFGKPGTNGGTMLFLCANSPPRADAPACPPATGGVVSGGLDASNIIGPVGQGVASGGFADFVSALRAGAVYVNVHTDASTPGEIRGNLD